MANTVIALKKSSTPSAIPSSLEFGELAINYADGKLYYKNTNSQIAQLITVNNNFGTVNANGVLIIADTSGDVFSLEQGSNIIIVGDAINDKITISANIAPAFDKANSTTYTSNVVISVTDNSNAALRVTQTGTGEIVRFEDSTNPDVTPFVIDANGTVLIGSSEPQLSTANSFGGLVQLIGPGAATSALSLYANTDTAAQSGSIRQHRRRTTGSVQSGDRIGIQQFAGFSGSTYRNAAQIAADIDPGVVSDSSMPGRLVFFTTSNNSATVTERMRIDSSGNVGIGTTSPTSNLHVIGTANITGIVEVGNTVNALDFNSTSDIKYKTDVKNIDDALNTICQLRGVSFTWKESQKPSYGLIAQEVQNVIPEIVSNNKDSSSLLLNYDALVGHFVEAIKELKEKIDVLEKKCDKYTKISKKRAD